MDQTLRIQHNSTLIINAS